MCCSGLGLRRPCWGSPVPPTAGGGLRFQLKGYSRAYSRENHTTLCKLCKQIQYKNKNELSSLGAVSEQLCLVEELCKHSACVLQISPHWDISKPKALIQESVSAVTPCTAPFRPGTSTSRRPEPRAPAGTGGNPHTPRG